MYIIRSFCKLCKDFFYFGPSAKICDLNYDLKVKPSTQDGRKKSLISKSTMQDWKIKA